MRIESAMNFRAWIFLITVVTLLSGCGGGRGGSSTSTYSVSGRVQKGPFAIGSEISINVLDTTLNPTGTVYNTQTSDALGDFALSSRISAQQVEIVAQGFYFDEISGQLSNAQIQLRTISDLSVNSLPTVNVLTTLQEQRLKTLVSMGQSFDAAGSQSEAEVLALFGITAASVNSLSTLDSMRIDGSSDQDAVLLAISVILSQIAADSSKANGTTQAAELSNLINTIAAGIASTGTLTSTTLGTEKNLANTQIVAATVTANLQAYYANNGVTVAAPPFVEWVDQTNSGILPQRLAPVTGLSFSALTTATPGQVTTSNVVTIAGAGTGVYVKVAASSGATIIKNGVAVDGQLAIARDGDTLALQVTAPGYNLGISLTLDVGSTSAQWKVASIPLGGTISGVTGTGLTLQDNAGDIITLTAGSTTFGFPAAIANGQPYSISVLTAPTSPLEACVVNNGAGTVGAAMVQIGVTCFAATELALTANLDSSNNGSISVYAIDPASGALNAVPGSPFATGSGVHSMAVDASGTYVIDANEGLGGISVYAINKATGSLALVSGSPFATGPNPSGTTVYNHGNFAFVVTSDSNLSVYSINDSTGALTSVGGSPFAIPQSIVCCGAYSQLRPLSNPAIDQTGGYVYLTWNNISIAAPSAGLIGFSINPVDGSLALLPGFPDLAAVGSVSGPPQSLVVAPNGNFAYSPEANVFSIDAATGAIGGGGSGSYEGQGSVAIAPNGLVAFTTTPAQGPGTIGAVMTYLVNPTTGALTPVSGSPFATGGYNPASAAVDLTGTYVLVSGASGGAGIISGFTINPASGYLTPMLGSPFTVGLANAFPNGIAFAPIP